MGKKFKISESLLNVLIEDVVTFNAIVNNSPAHPDYIKLLVKDFYNRVPKHQLEEIK